MDRAEIHLPRKPSAGDPEKIREDIDEDVFAKRKWLTEFSKLFVIAVFSKWNDVRGSVI